MSTLLDNLSLGFSVAASLHNIGFCLVGVLIGTMVGVLPGVGPVAAIALLLPATFGLPPAGALIMLAGIYYGAQYGGSTASILLNIPGEASSAVTAIEGHRMARQGKAAAALAIAAIGSFVAGTVATLVVAVLAVPMVAVALMFGPWEYFSLMVLGIVFAVVTAQGDSLKACSMALLGLLLSTVGTDTERGELRLTLGILQLYDGVGFVVVAMGLFGFAELLRALAAPPAGPSAASSGSVSALTTQELASSGMPIVRGTLIGSLLGLLPGGGAVLASFAAYLVEKWNMRHTDAFGRGAIQGVAAPESANNAAAQTSFVPLLALGIPSNAVMALMVGAMTLHGVQPGPNMMTKQPELFWGIVVSMWIANLLLLVINLPLVRVWAWTLRLPREHLFTVVVVFCCIGLYATSNSVFDVLLAVLIGVLGYGLLRNGFDPAPLLLCLVLGPLMEEHLRRAVLLGAGALTPFVSRPLSAVFLAGAAFFVCAILWRRIKTR